MPNLPTYDLPLGQSAINPQEGGATAMVRAGRVTQETAKSIGDMTAQSWHMFGNIVKEAGEVYTNYQTTADITDAAEKHTALAAQTAKDLPGIMAKADNPVQAAQDYYQNTWLPAAQEINSHMNTKEGRRWAALHLESASSSMLTHAIGEATNIQGAKTIAKFDQIADNVAAQVQSDPHSLDSAVMQYKSATEPMKAMLSPEQQANWEAHQQRAIGDITMSAAHALIEKDPGTFKAQLNSGWGKDYLTGQQRQALGNYVHTVERENRMEARMAQSERMQAYDANIFDDKGNLRRPTLDDIKGIMADKSLNPNQRRIQAARAMAAQRQFDRLKLEEDGGKDDAALKSVTTARVLDPEHRDPVTDEEFQKLEELYNKNPGKGMGLAPTTTARLREYQASLTDPKGTAKMGLVRDADNTIRALTKNQMAIGLPPPSEEATQKYAYMTEELRTYSQQIKAAHPEATDHDIYSPHGKYYFMTPEFMQKSRDYHPPVAPGAFGGSGGGGGVKAGGAPATSVPLTPAQQRQRADEILNGKKQ